MARQYLHTIPPPYSLSSCDLRQSRYQHTLLYSPEAIHIEICCVYSTPTYHNNISLVFLIFLVNSGHFNFSLKPWFKGTDVESSSGTSGARLFWKHEFYGPKTAEEFGFNNLQWYTRRNKLIHFGDILFVSTFTPYFYSGLLHSVWEDFLQHNI